MLTYNESKYDSFEIKGAYYVDADLLKRIVSTISAIKQEEEFSEEPILEFTLSVKDGSYKASSIDDVEHMPFYDRKNLEKLTLSIKIGGNFNYELTFDPRYHGFGGGIKLNVRAHRKSICSRAIEKTRSLVATAKVIYCFIYLYPILSILFTFVQSFMIAAVLAKFIHNGLNYQIGFLSFGASFFILYLLLFMLRFYITPIQFRIGPEAERYRRIYGYIIKFFVFLGVLIGIILAVPGAILALNQLR
jgi:hypothetical protein